MNDSQSTPGVDSRDEPACGSSDHIASSAAGSPTGQEGSGHVRTHASRQDSEESGRDGNSKPHEPGSLAELLAVAIPLVISAGSQSLMNVVDRLFLSWWDLNALAASLPAILLNWTILSIPFGIVVYTNTFIAQYDGARRRDRVAASLWQGIWMALLFGGLVSGLAPFLARGIDWLGHDPAVAHLEKGYFAILCYGAPAILLNQALTAFFSGRGETRVVMVVNIIASLSNGLGDWLLIFGWGSIPGLGMNGAAIATVGANVIACGLYAVLIARRAPKAGYPIGAQRRFDAELLYRMLRYGTPQGMQFIVDVAAFTLYIVFIGRLGNIEQAATNLAFTMNSLAFVPMFGFVTAILILVGRRIAEGRPDLAEQTTGHAIRLGGVYMLLFAVLYIVIPHWMLAPFATMPLEGDVTFEDVESLTVVLLRFVAVYTFFDAVAMIYGSAIRGAGDTRFSMWFTVFTSWPLLVIPTWFLTSRGYSVVICWIPITVYLIVLGAGFWLRFRAGHWKSMKVIDDEPPSDLAETSLGQPADPFPR